MDPLELVGLTKLMDLTIGSPEVVIGLVDGPVAMDHPDLARANMREIQGKVHGVCSVANSFACTHGTLVAGLLFGRRDSSVQAICPGCTALVRPIFSELIPANQDMPSATPEGLAEAILDCIGAGVRVINLSAAFVQSFSTRHQMLEEALNYAAARGVLVVAASGNQGVIGSTVITQHCWVIPVVACDRGGKPLEYSNLGAAIGHNGFRAPGDRVRTISTSGIVTDFSGTSAAVPFVSGTIALLMSQFPDVTPAGVRLALTMGSKRQKATIVPPLLNAWAAYQALSTMVRRRIL